MTQREYMNLLNNRDYYKIVKNFVSEYINYAYQLGYIGEDNYHKLVNINVVFDEELPGYAVTNGNTITINPKIFYSGPAVQTEKVSFSTISHELSHLLNSFHYEYLMKDNSIFRIFIDRYQQLSRDKFGVNMNINYTDSINNLHNISRNAGVLLDEAVAQEICEDVVAAKYGIDRNGEYRRVNYPFNITFSTNFEGYGIFQDIAERFSKTLAGVNSLNELAKLSVHRDVPYKILSEHIENSFAFKCLYDELCRMGLIVYAEYWLNGHANSGKPREDLVRQSYYELLRISDSGKEERIVINTPKVLVNRNSRTINW